MFFISMGSIECDAFYSELLILVVEGWKNPRDVLKTTLNSGCVLSLASLAASEADLSAKRRCFPQLLNVTKASTELVLKETTKVK